MAKSKGYDFEKFNDGQLTDHYHYTIFPNISFSVKPDGMQWLRGTPHPTDPTKCFFDYWYLTWFPENIKEYYYEYKTMPSLQVLKIKLGDVSTDLLLDSIVDELREVTKNLESPDLEFVKNETTEFCSKL